MLVYCVHGTPPVSHARHRFLPNPEQTEAEVSGEVLMILSGTHARTPVMSLRFPLFTTHEARTCDGDSPDRCSSWRALVKA